MKKKMIIGNILIVLGIIPFIFTLILAIYNSIVGWCLGFFSTCNKMYGFESFIGFITIFGYLFWYIFLIAFILLVIGFYLKKKAKVKKDVR